MGRPLLQLLYAIFLALQVVFFSFLLLFFCVFHPQQVNPLRRLTDLCSTDVRESERVRRNSFMRLTVEHLAMQKEFVL